jgi:hypothetical protein
MNPIPSPPRRNPPQCPAPTLSPTRRTSAGLTRLEFALAVIVAGVVATLALNRIAELHLSAQAARNETTAQQDRSAATLVEAHKTIASGTAASMPRLVTPAQALRP